MASARKLVRLSAACNCLISEALCQYIRISRAYRLRRNFEWMGFVLVGRTAVGRATVAVLDINDPQRIRLRIEFGEVGG
jgi:hypothetical protein